MTESRWDEPSAGMEDLQVKQVVQASLRKWQLSKD